MKSIRSIIGALALLLMAVSVQATPTPRLQFADCTFPPSGTNKLTWSPEGGDLWYDDSGQDHSADADWWDWDGNLIVLGFGYCVTNFQVTSTSQPSDAWVTVGIRSSTNPSVPLANWQREWYAVTGWISSPVDQYGEPMQEFGAIVLTNYRAVIFDSRGFAIATNCGVWSQEGIYALTTNCWWPLSIRQPGPSRYYVGVETLTGPEAGGHPQAIEGEEGDIITNWPAWTPLEAGGTIPEPTVLGPGCILILVCIVILCFSIIGFCFYKAIEKIWIARHPRPNPAPEDPDKG